MSFRYVIGVDPGLNGAVSIVDTITGDVESFDIPVHTEKKVTSKRKETLIGKYKNGNPKYKVTPEKATIKKTLNFGGLYTLLRDIVGNKNIVAVVEHQQTRPTNGPKQNFTIGLVYGSILTSIEVLRIPMTIVTPQIWKKSLGLSPKMIDNGEGKMVKEPPYTDKEKKEKSIALCKVEFSNYTPKRHDHAEATLIAHWFIKQQKES